MYLCGNGMLEFFPYIGCMYTLLSCVSLRIVWDSNTVKECVRYLLHHYYQAKAAFPTVTSSLCSLPDWQAMIVVT